MYPEKLFPHYLAEILTSLKSFPFLFKHINEIIDKNKDNILFIQGSRYFSEKIKMIELPTERNVKKESIPLHGKIASLEQYFLLMFDNLLQVKENGTINSVMDDISTSIKHKEELAELVYVLDQHLLAKRKKNEAPGFLHRSGLLLFTPSQQEERLTDKEVAALGKKIFNMAYSRFNIG